MADRRKNFFMADNRIFEYGLKPGGIAAPTYLFFAKRIGKPKETD